MKKLCDQFFELCSQVLARKFQIANALIMILLFVVFPGIIVIKGANVLVARHNVRENLKLRVALEAKLDKLSFFSHNNRFAHHLLYSLCNDYSGKKGQLAGLKKRLEKVKALYPHDFSFVVADLNGGVIPGFSDEKGFLYLYRQAFSLIADLEKCSDIAAVSDIEARLRRVRPLLGDLLREEDLLQPLLPRNAGSSILVSGSADKYHLWYGSGSDFRIIAFISRDFLKSTNGSQWAVSQLNKAYPDFKTGFVPYPPEESSLRASLSELETARVMRAIAENEGVAIVDPNNWNSNAILCRFLNQEFRGFCFKAGGSAENQTSQLFSLVARLLTLIVLIFYVLWIYQLRRPLALSIKMKISLFFAYSIILPMLIIGSIAGEYIQQTESEIIDGMKKQSQKMIENLDCNFEWYQKHLAARIKIVITRAFKQKANLVPDPKWAVKFNRDLKKLADQDELMLIDASGKDHLLGISPRISTNGALLKKFCVELIEIVILRDYQDRSKFNPGPFALALKSDGKPSIDLLGLGKLELQSYLQLLTDSGRNLANSFVAVLLWKESRLQEKFIKEYLEKQNLQFPGSQLVVFNRETDSMIHFPEDFTEDMNFGLAGFFRQAQGKQVYVDISVGTPGKAYVAVTMPGQKLDKLMLGFLFPASQINRIINDMVAGAIIVLLFLVLISSAGAFLLSSWIFKPLDELKTGIKAIAGHKFTARLEVMGENELGKLIKAFNSSIETLQDLEVARIVQESLFPEAHVKLNRIEILAKTAAMAKLGGDYFDLLKIDEETVLVFIGDATGHGIPAALSMAMAKSVMISEGLEKADQKKLMGKVHTLFAKLRSQGAKDFMTAASALINTVTGEVTVINAGHCYPVILRNGAIESELLSEIKGFPPGFLRSLQTEPGTVLMSPGDTLVLFTDGLIECQNSGGQFLGFVGMQKLVTDGHDFDISTHLNSIFAGIKKWEEQPTDDQTVILVRFA